MYYVYGLLDPRDQQVYYVGMTNNLRQRFSQHLKCDGTNKEKDRVTKEIIAAGHLPWMKTFARSNSILEIRQKEADWIIRLNKVATLTNMVLPTGEKRGGKVRSGRHRTEAQVKEIILQRLLTGSWPANISTSMRAWYNARYINPSGSHHYKTKMWLAEYRGKLIEEEFCAPAEEYVWREF